MKIKLYNEFINESNQVDFIYLTPSDAINHIKELLKKYKIPFDLERGDNFWGQEVTSFSFTYKKYEVLIEVFHIKTIVKFFLKNLDTGTKGSYEVNNIEDINNQIMDIVQSDVNKALLKINESKYTDTSWTKEIGGKEVTITIKDVEKLLSDVEPIDIPVKEIEDMCVHEGKTDKETLERSKKSDLKYPIIISKDLDGKYSMILDGHHRLLKAINLKKEFISALVLDLKDAPDTYQEMFTQ